MSIQVGSVVLNSHLSWRKRYSGGEAGSEASTLMGRTVVNRLAGDTEEIRLESVIEDNAAKGYFTKTQLDALDVLRRNGTTVVFYYHGFSCSVIITREGMAGIEKRHWKSEDADTDQYIGPLILKRV